ncbi:MAG: T9SS type A sorting domain-containing protein [Candidatus Cloacimonetes bacterium]|nr:T9SS type A sorting domain-containing protein [Candidatus Cloacimonadota bacterium]
MKKIITFIFLITLLSLNAGTIQKIYHFNNYKVSELDEYQTIEFENSQLQARTGEPVLPYISVSLLLPQGEIAESIEIIGSNETQIQGNYSLYPKQQVRPISTSASGEFIKNNVIYNSSEIYPQKLNGELITHFLHGYSIALTTFTPVMYIPANGTISYYNEVSVIVHTKKDERAQKALNNLHSNRNVIKRVNKIVQNPETIGSYPQVNSREGEYQLLIITPAQFEDDFDEMREVYLQQGMISQLETVEDIYSSLTGQDDQEKIRNYIIQEYQDHEVEYVLLAGDIEHVPYRGFYCYVNSGTGYEDNGIPSDLYYSALDGNWNNDGDNNWGEIGEDDLLPEVAVARFSFSTTADLENMLNKTITYQTQPVLGELRDPLLVGEHMYDDPLSWGADYLDLIIGFHDDNGYETTGIPEDHNITTMYDRDLGTWSGTELIEEINQGHSFIHHAGHSNYEYAMRLNNPDITNANFNVVNGVDHNYTFVYTHGCNCGSFDHNDGIGERMINIENFLAAFVGNSRYGWFNEGQTEGPSAHIHREFIDALYTDKYHRIGRAHMESKTETAPWLTAPGQHEEGAIRWCFYDCNVLGGSALPIWTDEPIVLDATFSPVIALNSIEFLVNIQSNGNPVNELQCTILQNGLFIGTSTSSASGDAIVAFDQGTLIPGDAELYLSGYNRPVEVHQLQVVPTGHFVTVSDYLVNSGNDNVIEFGENTLLSLALEELGNTGDVHGVVVEISSADDYIVISDNIENVGTIISGNIIELIDAFDFEIDNNIPNEHAIDINVEITSDEGDWNEQIEFIGYNAILDMLEVEVIDGDNNILDAGDTAEITVEIYNLGGADLYNLLPSISSSNANVTISNLAVLVDSLNSNTSENYVVCSVEVSDDAIAGDIIDFSFEITADNEFTFSEDFVLVVGLMIEDFESGDFTTFEWQQGGGEDWVIDDESHVGSYSAKSGEIGNNSTSSLSIELEVSSDGEISFWKKVSTELNYDYFKFSIDDNLQEQWSGDVDWSESVYSVNAGLHLFKWEYYKDGGVIGGGDCSWLDYIIFPPVAGEVGSNEDLLPNVTKLFGNYPNPFNPETTISFSVKQTSSFVNIYIFNIKGQKVRTIPVNLSGDEDKGSVTWNGTDKNNQPVASGIYFYQLNVDDKVIASKKCLLLK